MVLRQTGLENYVSNIPGFLNRAEVVSFLHYVVPSFCRSIFSSLKKMSKKLINKNEFPTPLRGYASIKNICVVFPSKKSFFRHPLPKKKKIGPAANNSIFFWLNSKFPAYLNFPTPIGSHPPSLALV